MKAWKFIPHQKKLHFRKKKVKGPGALTLPPPLLGARVLLSLFTRKRKRLRDIWFNWLSLVAPSVLFDIETLSVFWKYNSPKRPKNTFRIKKTHLKCLGMGKGNAYHCAWFISSVWYMLVLFMHRYIFNIYLLISKKVNQYDVSLRWTLIMLHNS